MNFPRIDTEKIEHAECNLLYKKWCCLRIMLIVLNNSTFQLFKKIQIMDYIYQREIQYYSLQSFITVI